MSLGQAKRDYGALLEEARALLELGRDASGLRPRVRTLTADLSGALAEAQALAAELAEVHRRAYHLETCLSGPDAAALPEPFSHDPQPTPSRSRPSSLSS